MPPTQITDPVVTVLDLLVANWTPANTQGLTPDFSNAWYDRVKDIATPKVTVTSSDEIETLLGMGAAGPATFWDGAVDVNHWTSRKVLNSAGTAEIGGALARKLAYEMRQETDRIIRENQNLVSGLQFIRVTSRRSIPDDRESPVVFRWLNEVTYNWIEQAA